MSVQDQIGAETAAFQGDLDAILAAQVAIKEVEQEQADALAALKAANPTADFTAMDAVQAKFASAVAGLATLEVAPAPTAAPAAPAPVEPAPVPAVVEAVPPGTGV